MSVHLVTGGSGYFGSLLVRSLLERGETVRVFDLIDADDRPADVEFVQGDIRDAGAVAAAVRGAHCIYHNVAQVPLARDHDLLRSVNVDGTEVLLQAARQHDVAKVVHTSSSAVFGVPEHNPVTIDTVPHPAEPYGRAKLAAEWACLRAATDGLDVSIVRPRTILGHGRLGIFGILFEWIADGASPVVLGDGTNRYQFVHAHDLASACIAAGERPTPGIYNIGAADVQPMVTTLDHLCRHADTGATVRTVPVALAERGMRVTATLGLTPFAPYHWLMYAREMWFDISVAERELAWNPTYSTDDMFAESYDWYVSHRNETIDHNRSHHRTSARQGVLSVAKRATGILRRAQPESEPPA